MKRKPRKPYPGRNLGRFMADGKEYRVRCVDKVLHFRPRHGREDSVVKVRLCDIPLLVAHCVFEVGEHQFGAWLQSDELRIKKLSNGDGQVYLVPLKAALDLAKSQTFLPFTPAKR